MKESDLIIGLMNAFGRKGYPVQSLIRLTAPFGTKESSVRTNLHRMSKKGLIFSEKEGRTACYYLGEKWLRITENIGRSFKTVNWDTWDKSWWGLVFSVPDREKGLRYKIRKKLTAYRFAPLQSGFWIRPFHEEENIAANLESLEENGYTRLLRFVPEKRFSVEIIENVWQLHSLNREMQGRLEELEKWYGKIDSLSPREALRQRMERGDRVIKTLVKDPLLPQSFLPDGWNGENLRSFFLKWDREVTKRAAPYIEECFKEAGDDKLSHQGADERY